MSASGEGRGKAFYPEILPIRPTPLDRPHRERLPGGPYTHWKAPPFHGARQKRTFSTRSLRAQASSGDLNPRSPNPIEPVNAGYPLSRAVIGGAFRFERKPYAVQAKKVESNLVRTLLP
jgi:hypothetical protein